MKTLLLNGNQLSINQAIEAVTQTVKLKIDTKCLPYINKSRKFIENIINKAEPVYGVNTGFGLLSNEKIKQKDLNALQENLIRSHAAGVGKPLDPLIVKLIILFKANSLIIGHSAVRPIIIEQLLNLFNQEIIPVVPQKGSVGASGDLAPLAHLSLVLMGEGEAFYRGKRISGSKALKIAGLDPIKLSAKEGLSLINGTQVMTAIGCWAYYLANILADTADVVGATTLDALQGTLAPFDPDIQRVRPHQGQEIVANNFLKLLEEDEIRENHKNDDDRVQDPYSLRCIPQVHGAARDIIDHVKTVLSKEINSVTDNPLVFPEKDKILSGGNFHGQPVAFAMDYLALGCAELGSIAERRIDKLVNPIFNLLPAFLVKNSGLNSGFMIPHVVAASLVSENKILCHPASIDSIPTSADKEDHVSMGTIAARKCIDVIYNVMHVLAIEVIAACQGLDFHKPLKPGIGPQKVYQHVRKKVPFFKKDIFFGPYIEDIKKDIEKGMFASIL